MRVVPMVVEGVLRKGSAPRLLLRLAGLVLGVCTPGACVFWDVGDWSKNVGRAPDTGAVTTPDAGPATIATAIANPWDIAVEQGNLYFTSNVDAGAIYKCSAPDCSHLETLASNLAGPARMALGADTVYWSNFGDGTVQSCAMSGCGETPTTVATGQASALGIATNTSTLYWAELTSPGSVLSCPLSGCPDAGPTVVAANEAYPYSIAADSTGVYWGTTGGDVRFCALGQCPQPTTLASQQGEVKYTVLGQGSLFWSDAEDQGSVDGCTETACTPMQLATAENPVDLAVDTTGIYWVEKNTPGGSVQMCPLTGCEPSGPRVLALGLNAPTGMALDATYVYVTDTGSGEIVRVAKP
jgi:hypothetical protein